MESWTQPFVLRYFYHGGAEECSHLTAIGDVVKSKNFKVNCQDLNVISATWLLSLVTPELSV